MGWTAYILGPIYSLLPKRWRYIDHQTSERFMVRCTIFTSILETLFSVLVLRYWYMTVLTWISDAYATRALSKDPGNAAHIAPELVGGAGFAIFITNPLTWVVCYFAAEGILRLAAAAITGEACGMFPLCVLDFIFLRITRGFGKIELPLVRDEILPGDSSCDIKIASCCRRPEWRYPFTIRYEKAFFQVIGTRFLSVGPRPFVYALRRLPPGEVARGLREYHPDDILIPAVRVQSLG